MISKASDMGPAGGEKGSERRLDFVIGIANMTWPGLAAVTSGFANLTAAGMRTTDVLNKSMNTLNAGMLAAGGAAALALGLMTAEAAKFEKQMKTVQSLIQEVDNSPMTIQKKMEDMTKTAKALAVEYGMSPVKVAEGLTVLGRAGITTAKEMNTVMEASVQLAKIEGIAVQDAATMTIQMTTLFGGSMARDASKFAEILAHAANVSTTSAKEIMTGMQYAGGIASSVWGSTNIYQRYDNASQMAAMIATLSQQGVSGPMAGTAIKSFVNYMVKGMPKSKRALGEIGLTEQDLKDASGNFLTLPEMMDLFTARFQKYFRDPNAPNQINQAKMYQWFVKWGEPRQAQQYMKMIATNPETGLHYIDEYVDKMEQEYKMQEKVNTVMSSASEKFNKAVAGIQVFAVNVGEKFLPVLGAIADVFSFIGQQAGLSDLLSWVTALSLMGFIMLGLKTVVQWLVPALKDMGNMFRLLAAGRRKEAFGFGTSVSGYQAETAAVTADTAALQANTVAKAENAAITAGTVTPMGSRADIARRTRNSKAVLAGATTAAMLPPMPAKQYDEIMKHTANTRAASGAMKKAISADAVLMDGLIAQNVLLEKKSRDLTIAKRRSIGAWEKAYGTRSFVGGRTASEARMAMLGANLANPLAWAPIATTTEATYLSRKARGLEPTARMASKLGPGKMSFLDGLYAAAIAESAYTSRMNESEAKQKNALNSKKNLIREEITANRKRISELKLNAKQLQEIEKLGLTTLPGGVGIFSQGKPTPEIAGWLKSGTQRSIGFGRPGSALFTDAAIMSAMMMPTRGVGVAAGKTAEEVVKVQAKAAAYQAERVLAQEGTYLAGSAGLIPTQAAIDRAIYERTLRGRIGTAGTKIKTAGQRGASGIGGLLGGLPVGRTALLAGGVVGIAALLAGIGMYQYGSDPKRRWWTPNTELQEDVNKAQQRHLQYLRKEYQAQVNREETLQKLKKKGYDVDAKYIDAKNRAEYLGGTDGTGGLIKYYADLYDSANKTTKYMKNIADYYQSTPERLSEQLIAPPMYPSQIPGIEATGYGIQAGNIDQMILNQRYGQYANLTRAQSENLEMAYFARNHAGLMSDPRMKARGEFAQTPGGVAALGQWTTDEASLMKYYEDINKGPQSLDYWIAAATWGFEPGMAGYKTAGEKNFDRLSGKYKKLRRKIDEGTATEYDKGVYKSLVTGSYVNSIWDAYDAAGAGGMIDYFMGGGDLASAMLTDVERQNLITKRKGAGTTGTGEITQQNQINIKTLNINGVSGTPEEQQSIITSALTRAYLTVTPANNGG